MLTLKESVRWLTLNHRHDEAWESLKWIRASDDAAVQLEMEEIRQGAAYEEQQREGFQLKEMISPDNWRRTATASGVFIAQQATGATAFAYFGPQYFKLLVGNKGNSDLLLTAIFGAIKVAACGCFVLFVADRVPRKKILIAGATFMAACQITCAAVVKTHPAQSTGDVTSSGIATVALIYLFVIAYNFSWGPLPWPYVSEIFPTRIREPGISVGVASQWYVLLLLLAPPPSHLHQLPSPSPSAPLSIASQPSHPRLTPRIQALQLRLQHQHPLHDRESGLGHLPPLGPLRPRHRRGLLPLFTRNKGQVPRGDRAYG